VAIPTDIEKLTPAEMIELIRALIAENAQLRAEIERLKSGGPSASPFSKNQRKANPKRPGRKPGHGLFRYRCAPDPASFSQPVREAPVTETACPHCGGELEADGTEIVTTTDLPELPRPVVKAYRVHLGCCLRCGRRVRGQHPDLPADQRGATGHRVGPRAQAAAALLHYAAGLPVRKVPAALKHLTGLTVTSGALTQAAERAVEAGALGARYAELRAELPHAPAINTDDTGWRIAGQRAQLMAFETTQTSVYQIRAQHRNEEVREVIGSDYGGVLCTDRGTSYDAAELKSVKQQKCLAHLQRSLGEVLAHKHGPARRFGEELKAIFKEAQALWRDFHDPQKSLPGYWRRVKELDLRLTWHLRPRQLKDADNQRLLDEIGRHHDRENVLRFLYEPVEVEPTNNAAERALRPAVIARKVSHCSKNERGARSFEAFTSVIRTMFKRGAKDVLEELANLMRPQPAQPAIENSS
jgi:hypothetical protein